MYPRNSGLVVQFWRCAVLPVSQNLNLNHQALLLALECHYGYWAQILEVNVPPEFLCEMTF